MGFLYGKEMTMNQIILANGRVIDAKTVTLEPHFSTKVKDWDAFIELIDMMTDENLLHVQIIKDDKPVASFNTCELVGTQTINNYDESMTVHIYLMGEVDQPVDPEYETAYRLMAGEIQA